MIDIHPGNSQVSDRLTGPKKYVMIISLMIIFGYQVLVVPQKGISQTTHKIPNKALQFYLLAQKNIESRNFRDAKSNLRKAIQVSPEYFESHLALADVLRLSQQFDSAAIHYQNVLHFHKDDAPSFVYFGYGESLLGLGKYKEAEKALNHFLAASDSSLHATESTDPTKNPRLLSKKYLKDITFSTAYFNNNKHDISDWEIIDLGSNINTKDDEYFPRFTADLTKLIFTRKTNEQENFYESDFFEYPSGSLAKLLEGQINSKNFNEGAHSISPDGKYIFFTGCNRSGGLGSCDIYISKKEKGVWSAPFNLGSPINTAGWEAQPSISADGKTLYFVSNRKGGYGGYDIWKSELLQTGKWSEPINLGPTINTPFDESAPFIHADNQTLFFTSNGWPGFGKKDFFFSKLENINEWSTPVNLGSIVNDHRDQSSIMISIHGDIGVFASQRDLTRKDLDLYSFKLPQSLKQNSVSYVNGIIFDNKSLENLSAKVTIFDLTGNKLYYDGESDLEDGRFLAPLKTGTTYTLHVEKPGYLLYSNQFELRDSLLSQDVYNLKIYLHKIEIGKQEILKNIFFDINKATLLSNSYFELDKLVEFLQMNPRISIEIGGHTDNTGSVTYNDELSEKRAKAVWQYLIDQGIEKSRLQFKGYGSKNPLSTNDNEEGRKINRRTDFKIISN